jgi:hypothetical protein
MNIIKNEYGLITNLLDEEIYDITLFGIHKRESFV